MDEGSRNIVKFIAAVTGAILLLMGAWFIGRPQEPEPVPVAAKVIEKSPKPAVPVEPAAEADSDQSTDDDGEEFAPINGEPVTE
jgi:hypothetical protein